MKESPKAPLEKPGAVPPRAPSEKPLSQAELRMHQERVRIAQANMEAARRAYGEAAKPSPESKRADAAYSEYLEEEVPVTNLSGATARRIDIINGRSWHEENLDTQIMNAETALTAAERGEPGTFLIFGQKAHKAWELKRDGARNALNEAKQKKAAFEQLKADMAAEAKRLEFATTGGKMAESKRLEASYTEELRRLNG